jgi:hypothetical protein
MSDVLDTIKSKKNEKITLVDICFNTVITCVFSLLVILCASVLWLCVTSRYYETTVIIDTINITPARTVYSEHLGELKTVIHDAVCQITAHDGQDIFTMPADMQLCKTLSVNHSVSARIFVNGMYGNKSLDELTP